MGDAVRMKIRGVYSLPNEFSEVPEGALRTGRNIVLNRDSVAETRRGLASYNTALAATVDQFTSYQDTLVVHHGTALERDTLPTYTPYSGTFEALSGFRVRFAQANKNLYLTTAAGVKKLDAIAGTWQSAGTPRPLDTLSVLSGATGFLPDDSAVAYRSTLHYDDANRNRIVSAPSQRLVVGNAAGGSRDVDLTIYLPDGLTTSHFLRTFRSPETGSVITEPNDEVQLVSEIQLTSQHISDGFVTFTDSLPSVLRGASLYTNPSQETIAFQNDLPPLAADIAEFAGHLLYANVRSKHRLATSLVGVGPGALYAFATTGDITNASAIVTNIPSTTDVQVGMRAKGTGIPAAARVLTIDGPTQVTLTHAATATTVGVAITFGSTVTLAGQTYFAHTSTVPANQEFLITSGGTPAENIEETALAFTFTVNQNPSNTLIYAFYTSGFEDVPGAIDFEERGIGGSTFTFSSSSGSAWSPDNTTALSSDNDAAENGVLVSKFQQPEAVPVGFRLFAGTSPIKRIIALRDVAYIFSDRIYQLTGTSLQNFSISLFDTTTRLLAPETAVAFNDQVFFFGDQGVAALSENGVRIVSRPIEDDLQRVSSSLFPEFPTIAFAVPYESSRTLLVAVPDSSSDTSPSKIWAYNAFTDAWVTWTIPCSAGLVNPADDKLYLASPDLLTLRRERKTFTADDYADEELEVEITAYTSGTTTLTLASTTGLEEGWAIRQDASESVIVEVVDSTTVTIEDSSESWSAGAATAYEPIDTELQWLPFSAGHPGVLKHWQDIVFIFRNPNARAFTVGFGTDFRPSMLEYEIFTDDLLGSWGAFEWGDAPWGDAERFEQALRTLVPRERSRSHWLNISVSLSVAFANFQLSGYTMCFEPMSSRFTP